MTVLVTGSAGHLGEALMRRLAKRGTPAVGLDIKASPHTHHVGSIEDRNLVRGLMESVSAVVHTATLHKPHVSTHTREQFVATNVNGTLTLLEEAARAKVGSFVFTSTTSAFGRALTAKADDPATWITEDVTPVAKNIYGATKVAAEGLCELFALNEGLPVLVLRTSRFFPEEDDNAAIAQAYSTANAQANELLYRRVDVEDIVDACFLAVERAPRLRFGTYIVSATTPFRKEHLAELAQDAPAVVARLFPEQPQIYAERGWRMFPRIDRVYVNDKARRDLGWEPRHDFASVLAKADFRSALAQEIGSKGYHAGA
jgi:UDP-glucose 4-epimerase